MSRPKLYIIMGKTMSGKTYLQEALEKRGIEPVKTHTTRPKRHEDEDGYIFESEMPYHNIAQRAYNVAGGRRWYYWLDKDDLNIKRDSTIITDFKGYKDIVKCVNIVDVEIVPLYLEVPLIDRMKNYVNSERAKDEEAELIRRLAADEEDFEELKYYNYCYKFKSAYEAYLFILNENPKSKS